VLALVLHCLYGSGFKWKIGRTMTTPPNPILSIPQRADFRIPVYFEDDIAKAYVEQLQGQFSKISRILDMLDESYFSPSIKSNEVNRIKGIQSALVNVVEEYLQGHPSNAYVIFSKMLQEYRLRDDIGLSQQYQVSKGTSLFRIQTEHDINKAGRWKKKEGFVDFRQAADLFHPPFHRRRTVGTNRFSISGYPCLYLSDNLLTSYSECFPKGQNVGQFNCVSLEAIRPLYFIDLSDDAFGQNEMLFEGLSTIAQQDKVKRVTDIVGYLGVYQLVLACHTKISYKETYKGEKIFFKAEYIIPQLLLQWLRQEGFAIDGIRYRSCTGQQKFPSVKNHYNYVLPVKSNHKSGHCPYLSALFRFGKVYSCLNGQPPIRTTQWLNHISRQLLANVL
jgi:hypothetical protein